MTEKNKTFWHKIDGPIGALFLAIAVGWIGYVVRGYEDGSIVAALMERIHAARMDERATQQASFAAQLEEIRKNAKDRDKQVELLIRQNTFLINLFDKASKDRNRQLAQLKALADKSATAATQATVVAASNKKTTEDVKQTVDTIASAVAAASQPPAPPPQTHTIWPWSKGH